MAVELNTFPLTSAKALKLSDAGTLITVEAGAASAALQARAVLVTAVGADFRVKAGPAVANGANGVRVQQGQSRLFLINIGDKIGVSAV